MGVDILLYKAAPHCLTVWFNEVVIRVLAPIIFKIAVGTGAAKNWVGT